MKNDGVHNYFFGQVNLPEGYRRKTMDWKDKNILVTGAAGFIGTWLCKRLVKLGANVFGFDLESFHHPFLMQSIGLDTRTVSWMQGDLRDYDEVERVVAESEPEVVIHLGAQPLVTVGRRLPRYTIDTNVMGTTNLLEAVRIRMPTAKIVIASSDKAYGDKNPAPYKETMQVSGEYPYEVSKSCVDLIAQTYYHTYDLNVVISRCGNVFGGGDINWSRIIPHTLKSLYNNSLINIRSSGQLKRDYIYIEDVIEGYLLLAELGKKGEAYNFGYNCCYSVIEVMETVFKVMGKVAFYHIAHKTDQEISEQWLDASKAMNTLGWKPQHSLQTGLLPTIQWYEKYFSKGE